MHVMIDIETLSIRQDAYILELAAVPFTAEKVMVEQAFHQYIKDDQPGRVIDNSTLRWWLGDGEDGAGTRARSKLSRGLNSTSATCLKTALAYMGIGIHRLDPEGVFVWAHGAVFDLGILRDAYAKADLSLPWAYRNERDTRTLFDFYKGPEVTIDSAERAAVEMLGEPFVKHCALHDAVAEAVRIQHMLVTR